MGMIRCNKHTKSAFADWRAAEVEEGGVGVAGEGGAAREAAGKLLQIVHVDATVGGVHQPLAVG